MKKKIKENKKKIKKCWDGYKLCPNDCSVKRVRKCGSGYDTTSYRGPSKAHSYAGVLFEKKLPGLIYLNESLKYPQNKCNNCCTYYKPRKKCCGCSSGHGPTPASQGISKTVVPAVNSFQDVLEIRKAMAFYDPKNYKKVKRKTPACLC